MNDFRRSENPTKPTTSDMTVSEILAAFAHECVASTYEKNKMNKHGDLNEPRLSFREALAAIEAHYAAIRKADMEYVIGEDEVIPESRYESHESFEKNVYGKKRNKLKAEQRQRMAERLNNTKEQV